MLKLTVWEQRITGDYVPETSINVSASTFQVFAEKQIQQCAVSSETISVRNIHLKNASGIIKKAAPENIHRALWDDNGGRWIHSSLPACCKMDLQKQPCTIYYYMVLNINNKICKVLHLGPYIPSLYYRLCAFYDFHEICMGFGDVYWNYCKWCKMV